MPNAADSMYPGGPKSYDVGEDNFEAADASMQLSPQERKLYKLHLQNLTGSGGVDNPDGSRSSLFATTVDVDNKTYVIPTVHKGKIVSPDEAFSIVEKQGFDNFPSYSSPEEAKKRYDAMHEFMDKDTKRFLQLRGK